MPRPHLEWVSTSDVVEEQIAEGPLRGTLQRTLSRDDETGAWTALVAFPGGWAGTLEGTGGLTELFVVDGELRVEGRRLNRNGYARLGPLPRDRVVASRPSSILVMADPSLPDAPATLAVETELQGWEPPSRGGLPGIVLKALWDGADGAPLCFLAANVPHFDTPAEFHSCPEEILVLAGDAGNERVQIRSGDYLWRPPFITHGPYHSETGLLVLLRGYGPIVAHWIDDPYATVADNESTLARLQAEGKA